MYNREADLVNDFKSYIEKPVNKFAISHFSFEFDYQCGRTDIIGKTADGHLVSFEAKLSLWKKALNQAYRNTSFSHYSYVLLPKIAALNAKKHLEEFTRRNVGLCFIEGKTVSIEIPATFKDPIQPWLTKSAINSMIAERENAKT